MALTDPKLKKKLIKEFEVIGSNSNHGNTSFCMLADHKFINNCTGKTEHKGSGGTRI